ncbi:MAG: hypothetical protein ACLP22_19415 [Solirubrobacteraceae bacterium]
MPRQTRLPRQFILLIGAAALATGTDETLMYRWFAETAPPILGAGRGEAGIKIVDL